MPGYQSDLQTQRLPPAFPLLAPANSALRKVRKCAREWRGQPCSPGPAARVQHWRWKQERVGRFGSRRILMETSWVPSCVKLCRGFRGREADCLIGAMRLICNKLLWPARHKAVIAKGAPRAYRGISQGISVQETCLSCPRIQCPTCLGRAGELPETSQVGCSWLPCPRSTPSPCLQGL